MKTMAKPEQFVTDATGKRAGVLLDLKTYHRLRDAKEELADIRAYDSARRKVDAEIKARKFASLSDYVKKRAARNDSSATPRQDNSRLKLTGRRAPSPRE